MEKKVNRFFGASTEIQAKWLNRMASEGWRLIRTGKMRYEFERCDLFLCHRLICNPRQ